MLADALLLVIFLFCATWVLGLVYLMWSLKRLPEFQQFQCCEPQSWPKLTVIIPACNEADNIVASVNTLISQNYPALEIILVNDRSTDNTGEMINKLAEQDPRIKALQIKTLPQGWLGKVHAMHQGVKQSSGGWLLFTDADIHYSDGMLRRAMALVLEREYDHLSLLPQALVQGFWLNVAVRTFGLLFLLTARAVFANKASSQVFVGIGAFNLVRKKVFERTPGFEWLRLEPADDMGLAMMMKQAGSRSFFALADQDLSVTWYHTISAMFTGLEKNMYGPGAHYQWWRMLFQVVRVWMLLLSPPLAVLLGLAFESDALIMVGLSSFAVHFWFSIFYIRGKQSDSIHLLLVPFGILLVTIMMLRAGVKCIKHQGIDWRGTHYPLAQLRAGQRVKL